MNPAKKIENPQKEVPETTIQRTQELEEMRIALMNMLEDTEVARREAEKARNKVQTIITNLSDGLLVFDPNGHLEIMNPQAEKIFGLKAQDMLGRTKDELASFPTMKNTLGALEDTEDVFRRDILIKKGLSAEVTKLQINLGAGQVGAMIILRNTTREKEIEHLKSEFVSLTAHQLRTPLAGTKWILRSFLDGEMGQLSPRQKEMIEKTYISNERMIDLINDLLNVTRIEEGRYLYQPVLLHMSDIIVEVVEDFKEQAKRKNIHIVITKPRQKLPRVLVDKEKITLALQNLIDNAIKYTPSDGKVTVSVAPTSSAKEVEVSVQDTGIGIPEPQQARVFDKFFRATNAQRVYTEGSGLGLYLVKNIVEAHGGTIRFRSREGDGTKFSIVLPIREEVGEFLKKL